MFINVQKQNSAIEAQLCVESKNSHLVGLGIKIWGAFKFTFAKELTELFYIQQFKLGYEGKDKRRLLVVLNLQVDTGLFVGHHRNPLVQVGPSLDPKLIMLTNCGEDNGPPSSLIFNDGAMTRGLYFKMLYYSWLHGQS